MNRLQKKAWRDLGLCLWGVVVGCVVFFYLIHNADKMTTFLENPNVRLLLLLFIVAIGVWVSIGPFMMKKRLLKGLDEREQLIYQKAKMVSDSVYSGLSVALFMGSLFWFGIKTPVPIYIPVCAFLAIAFLAEVIKPLMILIQCRREQADE